MEGFNFDGLERGIALGIGVLFILLVARSVSALIVHWSKAAKDSEGHENESRIRAEVLQDKLTDEIAKRVALEVEVKYLKKHIEALESRLDDIEFAYKSHRSRDRSTVDETIERIDHLEEVQDFHQLEGPNDG